MKLRMSKSFANFTDAQQFFNKAFEALDIKSCLQVDKDDNIYCAWDNQSKVWMSREFNVTGDHTFVVSAETDKVFHLYDLYVS